MYMYMNGLMTVGMQNGVMVSIGVSEKQDFEKRQFLEDGVCTVVQDKNGYVCSI